MPAHLREVASSTPPSARELGLVGAGCVILVGLLWFITLEGGAVGIARSDDWSYLLTAFAFHDSGSFLLNNWAVTMLVGQVLAAWPVIEMFGPSIGVLQGFVAVVSAIALFVTYVVIRHVLPSTWSVFALLALALSPLFGPSAISFMTDIPALALMSVSLLLGIQSFDQSSRRLLLVVLSAGASLLAFSFRDYAIVAIVAVITVSGIRARGARERTSLALILAGTLLTAFIAYSWRHSLANDLELPGWGFTYSVQLVAQAALTLSLLLVPVLLAARWPLLLSRISRRSTSRLAVAVVSALVIALLARGQLLGNVIHPFGTTWLLAGEGVRIWPLWFNRTLIAISCVACALLLFLIISSLGSVKVPFDTSHTQYSWAARIRTLARKSPVLLLLISFSLMLISAHVIGTLILGTWLIDRYFILLLPFLSASLLALLLRQGKVVEGRWQMVPWVGLAGLASLGLHVTDFDARFDGARWRAGDTLTTQGFTAQEIDAGMQWVSFHAQYIGTDDPPPGTRANRTWWTNRFPQQRVCTTVFAMDQSGSTESSSTSWPVRTLFGLSYTLEARPGPDTCAKVDLGGASEGGE